MKQNPIDQLKDRYRKKVERYNSTQEYLKKNVDTAIHRMQQH